MNDTQIQHRIIRGDVGSAESFDGGWSWLLRKPGVGGVFFFRALRGAVSDYAPQKMVFAKSDGGLPDLVGGTVTVALRHVTLGGLETLLFRAASCMAYSGVPDVMTSMLEQIVTGMCPLKRWYPTASQPFYPSSGIWLTEMQVILGRIVEGAELGR